MDPQELIKKFYLFAGAAPGDVQALSEITERKTYIAGDLVHSEGDVADAMYLVDMGSVDIVAKGKETVFATIGGGQSFGEFSFFEPGPRPASATTRERTYLLRVPYDRLAKVLAGRPELALVFYRNACTFFAKHLRIMASDLNRRYL
jgi:CRP/FNR family transcriptional regulator, cyclic AMP receptor protein